MPTSQVHSGKVSCADKDKVTPHLMAASPTTKYLCWLF